MKYIWFAVLFVHQFMYAQPPDSLWSRSFGGSGLEEGMQVQQTTDGGYILGGWTESFGAGNQDFYLVKTDPNGNRLWSCTFGGAAGDHGTSALQTEDGGFALAGWTFSFGSGIGDFWLVKTDLNGDSLWSRTYGGSGHDECRSVRQTSDGGYMLAGGTFSFGAGDWDYWLVKTDANGDSLWSRTYGGIYEDYCTTAQQTADGGYILGGWTDPSGLGIYDFWLVKTDANGDSLWSRTYGGNDIEWCWSVEQTTDRGYILGGLTMPVWLGPADALLVRTDSSGNGLWSHTYGESNFESCTSVLQTSDGGFLFGGATWSSGSGADDMWLVKTNGEGDSLWSRTLGGVNEDYCMALQQTSDGGLILCGATSSFGAGSFDAWVVKTSPYVVDANREIQLEPISFSLFAFPNPFNPSTTISYALPHDGHVRLSVFDLLGREVAVLTDGMSSAGEYRVSFDGSSRSSGIYFAQIQNSNYVETQKLLLLK